MEKFYITTPIYYVNDVPHIGHAYTTLAADVLARFYRGLLGKEKVFFLTGTDEHGANVAQAAEKHGKSPREYADEVAPRFQEAWETLGIKPDYFIRTTDPRHEKIAQQILQEIYDKKYIYPGTYEGWYCIGCEKFLTETEVVGGKCPLHPTREPVYQKEKNYFLKLEELSKKVLKKIEAGEYKILPEERHNEVVSRLRSGVRDISISRAGVSWGIPVPWDSSQTIYVWVEALFNYYSATRFLENKEVFWPPDLQIMAKDILWFHSVIWQALLIAADLSLPKTIFAHGFFTLDGAKMSKSLGNVISPQELVKKYGQDGARYLLMSQYPFGSDGDISLSRFTEKYNSDLANGLGNLVSRVAKLCEPFDPKELVETRENRSIREIKSFLVDPQHPNFLRIDLALDLIWGKIRGLDGYINRERPWEKETGDRKKILGEIIKGTEALTSLFEIITTLEPFMPETSKKMLSIFSGNKIVMPVEPLFPRI